MAKRTQRNKRGRDDESLPNPQRGVAPITNPPPNQTAKNPAAVQLGRLGGLKGGPARARKLTRQRRRQIARKAAQARWAKQHQP